MIQRLWIPGRLPGQNEIIDAAKSGRGKFNAYSRMKAELTNSCFAFACKHRIRAVPSARLRFTWHERDRPRDPDNVVAGQKFVIDGLVKAGVLKDDTRHFVTGLEHDFVYGGLQGVFVDIESEDE